MNLLNSRRLAVNLVLILMAAVASPLATAEAVEQKVRLEVVTPDGGGQCEVKAVFKGDTDNCKNNKKAKGRDNCHKDTGCVCTRKEKHITWEMKNKEPFSIAFDQGSANPFVQKGSSECNFKSNKKGKLRCRVKGKDIPSAIYRYSIKVDNCKPAQAELKIY